MFCTNCGAQLKENMNFCTQCGNKISNVQPAWQPDIKQTPAFEQPVSNPVIPHFEDESKLEETKAYYDFGNNTSPYQANDQEPAQPEYVTECEPVAQPDPVAEPEPAFAPETPIVQSTQYTANTSAPQYAQDMQNGAYQPSVYQQPNSALHNINSQFANFLKSNSGIVGIILASLVILLSALSFANPVGGLFGYAIKLTEEIPPFFDAIATPVLYMYFAVEGEVFVGFLAAICSVVAMIGGLVAVIMLITYIVKGLRGTNKPKRARIAMIICLIVTLLQVSSIMYFNSSLANKLRNEVLYVDAFDLGEEDIEDFYDDIGIDIDDIDDEDDFDDAMDKLLENIVKPTALQYSIIIVSILGIILIKKETK